MRIEQIELGGSNMFDKGVRQRQLEVCEDEQSKIALLGYVTCECDEKRKLGQHGSKAQE